MRACKELTTTCSGGPVGRWGTHDVVAFLFAAIIALAVALPAAAKVLHEEPFDGALRTGTHTGEFLTGRGARGWHARQGGDSAVEGGFAAIPLTEIAKGLDNTGTISIRVMRDETPGKVEALFSLADDRMHRLAVFELHWEGSRQALYIYNPKGYRLWHTMVPEYSADSTPKFKKDTIFPLGRSVNRGEWVTFSFSWGPTPDLCRLYVDGKALEAEADAPLEMPELLRAARYVIVGAEIDGYGYWSQLHSVVRDMRIFDVPLNPYLWEQRPVIASLADDSFKVAGISGKLVAGDTVGVEMKASPGGKATFDLGRVKGVAMTEVPPTEGGPGVPAVEGGTYRGSYTILAGDDFSDGQVVGKFVSQDNVVAEPVLSAARWMIETKPVVSFSVDRRDLPADSLTKARIKLVAKDANGNPVAGRHMKLTLSTTDEYTGTVGAGDFGKEVGAQVETRWKGETDAWGEVEFDYTAGFAAKTVILSAKDLDSGGVSVEYLTAYKEASIDIALSAPVSRAAARRGLQYVVKVEATRTELTADGRSRSVIRATVVDPNGATVSGDPVSFTLSSSNGVLKTIRGVTDSSGVATAEYVAGKKIGIVVVTATASLRNASGNVSITLLSDAPSKIYLKARPEELPADGFSRAEIDVKVTDVNDNPNKDTKVEFKVARGGGKVEQPQATTDRFGDASNRYVAGTTPGIATVVATVRSKVPTEAELAKARNVLFVPYQADTDEVRVEKWLRKKGDSVIKGEPLAEYSLGRSRTPSVLCAPCDGTLGDIFVEYWDTAEVGQTLAVFTPAAP